MLDMLQSFFDEIVRTFRVVDAADILIVSVFLYAALVWFQQTASRGVLIGIALLTALYFVARGLDMYLTSLAFQTSFAILLFVLVVVFQEDLRRMFERLSALRSVSFAKETEADHAVDELVQSTFKLAATKTGALLVLKGREPLERHLAGGVALGGAVSAPLLYSIFDPHSPGHDGAAVVERDRIERFAAHLPISKNIKEIAGRGTRHSAALGLSECSDALTIVVSEERGIVSVAEAGKLKEMPTAGDLKRRIDRFLAATFPAEAPSSSQRFLLRHWQLKLLALVIATVAWFVLAYDPHTVQRTFAVAVEYRNLPQRLVLDERAPNEVRVTLTGLDRDFRFLDPSTLKVSLDLANASAGIQELAVTQDTMRLPANLIPYRIDPRTIRLNLRPKAPSDTKPAGSATVN